MKRVASPQTPARIGLEPAVGAAFTRRSHSHRPGPRYRRPGSGRAVWAVAGLLLLTLALLVLRYGW